MPHRKYVNKYLEFLLRCGNNIWVSANIIILSIGIVGIQYFCDKLKIIMNSSVRGKFSSKTSQTKNKLYQSTQRPQLAHPASSSAVIRDYLEIVKVWEKNNQIILNFSNKKCVTISQYVKWKCSNGPFVVSILLCLFSISILQSAKMSWKYSFCNM